MTRSGFRPSLARTQNAMKIINGTKTNATIRDLEEEEGELQEKEGTVISIKRDLINGAGWTVKDTEGNTYICSCASSMYEIPEGIERGGILYPPENTVKVTFTINPVLKINTIKEIKSLGEETKKMDISQWQHGEESTTVIAKPKSALSISDGFIKIDYNNNNKVVASNKGISTEGKATNINTDTLYINSENINVQGTTLSEMIGNEALEISNEHESFDIDAPSDINIVLDRSNNITQLTINSDDSVKIDNHYIIGEIKDQKSIPIRIQTQQLLTDGNCISIITIDTNGIISISPTSINPCTEERMILSTNTWITPRTQSRNYIKVTVNHYCDNCDNGNNTTMEYVNYCPKCNNWNVLSNTGKYIRCSCGEKYCQNCGISINNTSLRLKTFVDNYIPTYGKTCQYCEKQLSGGIIKYYVDYCPNCREWNILEQDEYINDSGDTVIVLRCTHCDSVFCSTCGTDQEHHGLTITDAKVQYSSYKNALRKLKYIKDGG